MTVVKIKQQMAHKKCVIKKNIKFEIFENCLQATQIEDNINNIAKYKIDIDSLKIDQKDFIKNNKLISKIQQSYKSERHNVSTEEMNKIVLCSNDDKRMHSVDLIETYAYEMSKYLVSEKEEIKFNNIVKRCNND